VVQEVEADIITAFHATGDFRHRDKWCIGVKHVEEVAHYLPRIGMRCRCVFENGGTTLYSSSYTYATGHIVFSETDESLGNVTVYTLDELSDHRTRVTLAYYIKDELLTLLLFQLKEKTKLSAQLQGSLYNLKNFLKGFKINNGAAEPLENKEGWPEDQPSLS
jgi:hypothetical protein